MMTINILRINKLKGRVLKLFFGTSTSDFGTGSSQSAIIVANRATAFGYLGRDDVHIETLDIKNVKAIGEFETPVGNCVTVNRQRGTTDVHIAPGSCQSVNADMSKTKPRHDVVSWVNYFVNALSWFTQSGRYLTLVFLLVLSLNQTVFSQSEWPIFRGNQQLTASVNTALPNQLQLLASFQTEDDIKASPVVKDGIIYCGSTDGYFYAFNLKGELKWKFNAENAIEAPAVLLDGKVIFGSLDGWLFCLNQGDGTVVWKYKTDNQIIGSANWHTTNGQTVLAVGSYDYFLHGVGLAGGDGLWKYESDNFINGAPALYKNSVVFGGCDGFLHLVNLQTGQVARKIELSTYMASSPAIVGNEAYIGDYEGRFFAVDLESGVVRWTYDNVEKNLPFIASPAISGNHIVAGNEDRQLYCFSRKDGTLVWTKRLSNRINSSSVIAGSKVVTATMDGMLFMHNLQTGEELQQYELGSQMTSSPAVYDGKIIIGANDGRIYILGK